MHKVLSTALAFFSLLVLLAVACLRGEAPTQTITAVPGRDTTSLSSKPSWEGEWERTLSEARKEGTVVVYTGYGAAWRTAFADAMLSKYGITLETVMGRSPEIAERVMREQRTNTRRADAVVVGAIQQLRIFQPEGVLQPLEKMLILPEVIDPKVWMDGRFPYLDTAIKTGAYFYQYVLPPLTMNTDLVGAGEMKAWKDLLNPKWKGRILLNDPTISSGGQSIMTMLAYGIMDWDYIREFVKQEPLISRDERLLVEWIARGKYPVSIDGAREIIFNFVKEGAPLKQIVPSEGGYMTSGTGNICAPVGAPHPNASKVFINFLLTREGQTLSSKATGHQSARTDVPVDHLDPVMVRQPGMKLIRNTDKDFLAKQPEIVAKVIEMFKPLAK